MLTSAIILVYLNIVLKQKKGKIVLAVVVHFIHKL